MHCHATEFRSPKAGNPKAGRSELGNQYKEPAYEGLVPRTHAVLCSTSMTRKKIQKQQVPFKSFVKNMEDVADWLKVSYIMRLDNTHTHTLFLSDSCQAPVFDRGSEHCVENEKRLQC